MLKRPLLFIFRSVYKESVGLNMSGRPRHHNVSHQSKADLKAKHIRTAKAKLGGEDKAQEILDDWKAHREAEGESDRLVNYSK